MGSTILQNRCFRLEFDENSLLSLQCRGETESHSEYVRALMEVNHAVRAEARRNTSLLVDCRGTAHRDFAGPLRENWQEVLQGFHRIALLVRGTDEKLYVQDFAKKNGLPIQVFVNVPFALAYLEG